MRLVRLCVFPFGTHLRQATFLRSANYVGNAETFLRTTDRYSMTSTIVKNLSLCPYSFDHVPIF